MKKLIGFMVSLFILVILLSIVFTSYMFKKQDRTMSYLYTQEDVDGILDEDAPSSRKSDENGTFRTVMTISLMIVSASTLIFGFLFINERIRILSSKEEQMPLDMKIIKEIADSAGKEKSSQNKDDDDQLIQKARMILNSDHGSKSDDKETDIMSQAMNIINPDSGRKTRSDDEEELMARARKILNIKDETETEAPPVVPAITQPSVPQVSVSQFELGNFLESEMNRLLILDFVRNDKSAVVMSDMKSISEVLDMITDELGTDIKVELNTDVNAALDIKGSDKELGSDIRERITELINNALGKVTFEEQTVKIRFPII